jgi:hypothetical protein
VPCTPHVLLSIPNRVCLLCKQLCPSLDSRFVTADNMITCAQNLCRRYGTRLPSVPAAPAAPHREPTNNANDISAAQDPSSTSVLGMSPVGGSPPDLQIRGGSSSGRFVRLYPDGADPSQPWEPGTPSNENVLATQQVWDSLSRGQQTAYRVSPSCDVMSLDYGRRF